MKWLIPITITEYGRVAVIEADSQKEAIAKMRDSEWEELTDADRFWIQKSGKAVRDPQQ